MFQRLSGLFSDEMEHNSKKTNKAPKTGDFKIDSQKKDVDQKIDESRRDFLKFLGFGVAAMAAPAALTGCDEVWVFDKNSFYQNFRFSDYSRIDDSERKVWNEVEGYNNGDIGVALNSCAREDLVFCPDLSEIVGFKFGGGGRWIEAFPLVKSQEEVELILKKQGFVWSELSYIFSEAVVELSIKDNDGHKFLFSANNSSIFIIGYGKNGLVRDFSFHNYGFTGAGVFCMSSYKAYDEEFKEDLYMTKKVKFVSSLGEVCTVDDDGVNSFQRSSKDEAFVIDSLDDVKRFLDEAEVSADCNCMLNKEDLLRRMGFGLNKNKTAYLDVSKLSSVEELIDLIKKMPREPEVFAGFVDACCVYETNDKGPKDEFRHPVETLKSGWADCDDYALLNYFWAYLNGYSPWVMSILDENKVGHVFIHFRDEKGEVVVIDNSRVTRLSKDKDEFYYLNKYYPGQSVSFNGEM